MTVLSLKCVFLGDNSACFLQITGGSSGIGKAIAVEVAKRGANVTLIARNQVRLSSVSNVPSFAFNNVIQ